MKCCRFNPPRRTAPATKLIPSFSRRIFYFIKIEKQLVLMRDL